MHNLYWAIRRRDQRNRNYFGKNPKQLEDNELRLPIEYLRPNSTGQVIGVWDNMDGQFVENPTRIHQPGEIQYGQPCEENRGFLPCIDGRYRSCVSDAECAWTHFAAGPKCVPDKDVPGSRECAITIPSIAPSLP
jgi:hypothetical protein